MASAWRGGSFSGVPSALFLTPDLVGMGLKPSRSQSSRVTTRSTPSMAIAVEASMALMVAWA